MHHLAIDPWSIKEVGSAIGGLNRADASQTGRFTLWSLGKDALRAWDGLLSVDWIGAWVFSLKTWYSR